MNEFLVNLYHSLVVIISPQATLALLNSLRDLTAVGRKQPQYNIKEASLNRATQFCVRCCAVDREVGCATKGSNHCILHCLCPTTFSTKTLLIKRSVVRR